MVWDPVWEDIFLKHSWGKYPAEDLIRFIARNFYSVPSRSEINILEVGCGPRSQFMVYGPRGLHGLWH